MMKQSSSRIHRNKGWKVKHVLQICILATVCIWLIYQVKHSHDRKKTPEVLSKPSNAIEENKTGTLKLGRKDPQQKSTDISEGEEREVAEGTEEHEEDKIDDNEDMPDEIDHENEEIDRDDIDEKSQEAREVHYKADDASSAVEPQKKIEDIPKEQISDGSSHPTVGDHQNNDSISVQIISNSEIKPVSKEQLSDVSSHGLNVAAVSPDSIMDHDNSTSTSAQSISNSTITPVPDSIKDHVKDTSALDQSISNSIITPDSGDAVKSELGNQTDPVSLVIPKEAQSPGKLVSAETGQSPEVDQNKITQVNGMSPNQRYNMTMPEEKGLAAE